MTRTLLLCACLATVSGCSSIRKTVNKGTPEKAAEAPKQYEYRDMSRGGNSAFAHPNPGSPTMVR